MNKNKRSIILLVLILLVFLAYYIGYRPIQKYGEKLEEEILALNSNIDSLKPDYLRIDEIKEEILYIEKENEKKLLAYPSKLSQELGFRLLLDIEKRTGVEFKDVGFEKPELIDLSSLGLEKSEKENIYLQRLSTSTISDYKGLKDILNFIYEYKNMTLIENFNISDIDGTTDLKLDMTLCMIGVSSSSNKGIAKFNKSNLGKDVFFDLLYGEILDPENAYIEKKYREERKANNGKVSKKIVNVDELADILIDVHSVKADEEAQMIGTLGVNPSSSVISSDVNGKVSIDISFETKGSNILARYFMNGKEHSETFELGKALEMDIYSAKRQGADDYSSIVLNVKNKTAHTLYINIHKDDPNLSRIEWGEMQGTYELR